MANSVNPKALEAFLNGEINATADTIAIALIRDTYTFNPAHEFLSDLPGGVVVATGALTGKATTNGVLTANSVTFTALTGNPVGGYFLIKDTGVAATSRLIGWVDEYESGQPIAFDPDGSDFVLQFTLQGVFTL